MMGLVAIQSEVSSPSPWLLKLAMCPLDKESFDWFDDLLLFFKEDWTNKWGIGGKKNKQIIQV